MSYIVVWHNSEGEHRESFDQLPDAIDREMGLHLLDVPAFVVTSAQGELF